MKSKPLYVFTPGLALLSFAFVIAFSTFAQAQTSNRQLTQAPTAPAQNSEKRVALVIGNGSYKNAPPLRNPPNDATLVAATLRQLGFEVKSGSNLTQREMKQRIREFGQTLRTNGGVGLFYFAGHGVQAKGHNYLVPVDADIQTEADLEDTAVDLNYVLGLMDDAQNALNIVVLDACRNNPFARGFRSAQEGLAQVKAPTGTLIAYATAPDSTAADGTGADSPYTEELIKQMQAAGVLVETMFRRVTEQVSARTSGKQEPWFSANVKGDFYFGGRTNTGTNLGVSSPADSKSPANSSVTLPEWPKPERDLPAPVRLAWKERQLSFNVPSGWTRTQREQGESYQQTDFRAPDSPQTNISIQLYRKGAPHQLINGSAEIYSDAEDFLKHRSAIYTTQKVSAKLTDPEVLNYPTGHWQTFTADVLDLGTMNSHSPSLVAMLDAVYPDDLWQKQNVSFECSTCVEVKPGSLNKFNRTRHSYAIQQIGDSYAGRIVVLVYTAPIEQFDEKMLPSLLATLRMSSSANGNTQPNETTSARTAPQSSPSTESSNSVSRRRFSRRSFMIK